MLEPGTRLGAFEVLGPLGAGGMGEVYRARDTRLGREVALKVLTESLGRNSVVLSRFEREARALASLNPRHASFHPGGEWLATSNLRTVTFWPTRQPRSYLRVLHELTNLRVVDDAQSSSGYRLEVGPFPGWQTSPTW
jgi:serine/threonine protein kinase